MLVGRSNVGKSSLINALTRQKVARTSAEPGKTRLANVYRIERESAPPFHLVDLPGYGYARREKAQNTGQPAFEEVARAAFDRHPAALLLVDARHPGLDSDRSAWAWMTAATERAAVVATKIDKLARGERIRAMRQLQSVYDAPVVPVSAATGEGMEDLWKLIASLSKPRPRRTNPNA